jgi:hypothetical protein
MARKQKIKTHMKAITYILTITLSLTFSDMFAANGEDRAMFSSSTNMDNALITSLAPSLPDVATFDEYPPDEASLTPFIIWALAPLTPQEADFSEEPGTHNPMITELSPSLPTEATFDEIL